MEAICKAIEKNRSLIFEAEDYVWKNPETGYKEFKTSKYMEKKFRELGYELTLADGITGFYTQIDTGREGPEVLVLGELDSIICPAHKDADAETGAVHACGHNAQCAALLGIAAALKEPSVLDRLSGRIRLCAVPAEELLEIEFRSELQKEGKIKYMGGKSEFLHRGYFDGVDMAIMVHTWDCFKVSRGTVGFVAKSVTYKGVAAHAGGAPWEGRNALYAANCGLNAINALRETFRESDIIRIHPIITNGGDMVNAIPEKVSLETYVRGSSVEAIADANAKVTRALCGAALSLGTNIDIVDIPGYSPLINDTEMMLVAKEAAELSLPDEKLEFDDSISSISTDMGDLSCLMPVVHPYAAGIGGKLHGNDFEIRDKESACVSSAKWQLAMLHLLLRDGAERARKIVANFTPVFPSKEAFLAYQDSLNASGDRIIYAEDKTVTIRLS